MVYEFKFPDVGEGIHEVEIVKWLVKEGDKVHADQPLGEIETDKAIVEMPSPKSGKILKIHVPAGSKIHVGETMVTIQEEHETEADVKKHIEEKAQEKQETKKETAEQIPHSIEKKHDVPYTGSVVGFVEEAKSVSPIYSAKVQKPQQVQTQVQATPAVRNLAKQLNINLETLKGTGPEGRITIDDVQKAAGTAKKEELAAPAGIKVTRRYDLFGYVERVPLHGVKKVVA